MRLTPNPAHSRRLLQGAALAVLPLLALGARAAVPGISGTSPSVTFNLTVGPTHITQPNGQSVYAFGYGCGDTSSNTFLPTGIPGSCSLPQLPGPTLIVHEGDQVTIVLTNNLPGAVGSTSILFPGFQVTTSGGTTGLLTQEAPNAATCTSTPATCNTVSYTFTAKSPGTHSYYSGTQGDLQIEMGLFGAVVVLPSSPASCPQSNLTAEAATGETDFRLARSAYDNNAYTCYDREYLFQFSEMDQGIHYQVEAQVNADIAAKAKGAPGCSSGSGCLNVVTEPYQANYFMINGRSMPDDMDPNYAPQYPSQPYNGNPHMHPGELTLLRIIGQGRYQHPFHEHANHVRVLARDANLLLTPDGKPAGPLLFTTTTTPGMTIDGIFQYTAKGLNWDIYGHDTAGAASVYNNAGDNRYANYNGKPVVCIPDANGYYTSDPAAPNYYEWCGDHNKALEKHPFGQVAAGGPMTLPDPNVVTNGAWYSGSAYFGPDALARAVGGSPLPPFGTVANSPATEAGYAYMWHSHNEREITTDDIFPGGMMMMMLVDPRVFAINEAN
jgi:FtsP/CotA-like multicopper oxidase with cupredoxin domain